MEQEQGWECLVVMVALSPISVWPVAGLCCGGGWC